MSDTEWQGQKASPHLPVSEKLLDDDAVIPDTPPAIPASQQTIPSTQDPRSPVDPNQSFRTELNDDRDGDSIIIPSSLTPPPSTQPPGRHHSQDHSQDHTHVGCSFGARRPATEGMFSPPVTGLVSVHRDRDSGLSIEYVAPTPDQVVGSSSDELRAMVQACLAEHAKLKMETAHHRLQFNLLSMQANEDATRAAIEHDIIRREVEILKQAEHSRQARQELALAAESVQHKYMHLKAWYEDAVAENESYRRRLKSAKKVIQQKEDDIVSLTDERDLLLTRIRENREHFNMLCSPGGIFHNAMTPKSNQLSTPQAGRGTPRQNARHVPPRVNTEHGQERFAVLLQALHQENNSAPSTPLTATHPAPRLPTRHTRAVQSLSSLPTTPTARPRGADNGALLPSVDLVPQTEPPPHHPAGPTYGHWQYPSTATGTPSKGHKSRESTISAEDNEELARQAVEAAAQSSFLSQRSRRLEEEDIYESQASQAANDMLRRDPRESFEIASSVGSRDVTPVPAEKTTKLQAKLYGGVGKGAVGHDKRKFSGVAVEALDESSRTVGSSPHKKARTSGTSDGGKVGLGIQYSRDT